MPRFLILGFLLLPTASCDAPQPAITETAAPAFDLPKELCNDAKMALEKVAGGYGFRAG